MLGALLALTHVALTILLTGGVRVGVGCMTHGIAMELGEGRDTMGWRWRGGNLGEVEQVVHAPTSGHRRYHVWDGRAGSCWEDLVS